VAVYSMVWWRYNKQYAMFNREGTPITVEVDGKTSYHFSFDMDYHTPQATAWAERLEQLEIEQDVEYVHQTSTLTDTMKDAYNRVLGYWLDRGRAKEPILPDLVAWARKILTTPVGDEDPTTLFIGESAKSAVEIVMKKFIELVKGREFPNYGHYWPNQERVRLLELRLQGMKFKDISERMGRTNPACRAQYGRIRRGTDNVTIELQDWDIFKEAMPLGIQAKEKKNADNASENPPVHIAG